MSRKARCTGGRSGKQVANVRMCHRERSIGAAQLRSRRGCDAQGGAVEREAEQARGGEGKRWRAREGGEERRGERERERERRGEERRGGGGEGERWRKRGKRRGQRGRARARRPAGGEADGTLWQQERTHGVTGRSRRDAAGRAAHLGLLGRA